MESFEAKLSRATAQENREILGAIGVVVSREGMKSFVRPIEFLANFYRKRSLSLCIGASNSRL